MKTFSQLISEVAQPRGEDEKHFKDKHIVTKKKHPVAPDEVFTGGIKKAPKRLADYDKDEDELVYEGSVFDVPTAEGGEHDEEESHKKYKRGNKSTPLRREEADQIDEISRDTARSYIRKAMAHKTTGETQKKDRSSSVNLAGKKAYGIGGKARVNATESVDEALKPTTKMGTWIKDFQKSDAPQFKGKSQEKRRQMAIAAKYGAEREMGMREESDLEEKLVGGQNKLDHNKNGKIDAHDFHLMRKKKNKEVDLDESWSDGISSRSAHTHGFAASKYRKKAIASATMAKQHDKGSPEHSKHMADYHSTMAKHIKSSYHAGQWSDMATAKKDHKVEMDKAKEYKGKMSEGVEQIDEISKSTAISALRKRQSHADDFYAGPDDEKKAQKTLKMIQKKFGSKTSKDAERGIEIDRKGRGPRDTGNDYLDAKSGVYSGFSRSNSKRGTKQRLGYMRMNKGSFSQKPKANMAENAWEEVPMMMRQLQFIAYAAEEIMDYLDMGVDPEEWYQNKLASVHDQMTTLHAYMEGDKRMMAKMDNEMYSEEAALDEVTRTALKKTVSYIGPDGKSHSRNVPIKNVGRDDYGQEKIRANESINEVFNQGSIKLNNGSSIILKKEDADVLNRMFKSLSSSNRKRMEEIVMRDKSGFNEILSFAKEAL